MRNYCCHKQQIFMIIAIIFIFHCHFYYKATSYIFNHQLQRFKGQFHRHFAVERENDENKNKRNSIWRKPLIVPQDSLENTQAKMKTWREKQGMKSEDRLRLDRNWRTGRCKHKVTFEGVDIIRKIRFCGDYLAFGLIDGRVCMIRISTGDIVEKYKHHENEVSAIDYDGLTLCSGSTSGETVIYKLGYMKQSQDVMQKNTTLPGDTNPSSNEVKLKTMGEFIYKFKLHRRAVSSMKIVRMFNTDRRTKVTTETSLMISCGMDKRLVAIDLNSGELKYEQELDAAPLCMGAHGKYLAVGMIDGRVLFFNAQTGQMILQFQAHRHRVRSLFFQSDVILVTGSNKGVVKRWDLSGGASEEDTADEEKKKEIDAAKAIADNISAVSNSSSDSALHTNITDATNFYKPTRFLDYYFRDVIQPYTTRSSSSTRSSSDGLSGSFNADSSSMRRDALSPKPGSTADRLLKKQSMEENSSTTASTDTVELKNELFEDNKLNRNGTHSIDEDDTETDDEEDDEAVEIIFETYADEEDDEDEDDDEDYEIIYETFNDEGEYYYSAAIEEAAGNTGSSDITKRTTDAYESIDDEDDDEEYEIVEYIVDEDGNEIETSRKKISPKVKTTQEWEDDDPSPQDKRVRVFHRETFDTAVAVVAVQSDDDKIIAAYEDGTIVSWDVISRETNFELQGRSNLISNLQFDASKLIADGTSNILVVHDFNDPPANPEDLRYDLTRGNELKRDTDDD